MTSREEIVSRLDACQDHLLRAMALAQGALRPPPSPLAALRWSWLQCSAEDRAQFLREITAGERPDDEP